MRSQTSRDGAWVSLRPASVSLRAGCLALARRVPLLSGSACLPSVAAADPHGEFAHDQDGEEVTLTGSEESKRLLVEAKKTRLRIAGEKGV